MKFVPDLPQPTTAPEAGAEVKAVAGIKGARPVQARTLPPLIVRPHGRKKTFPDAAQEKEKGSNPRSHGERRVDCRRAERHPVLLELRSGVERRHRKQRAGDPTEHVDEKA